MKESTIRGASFCHVDKIRHEIHEIEAITDGYHRWQGTIPNLRARDINRSIYIILLGYDRLNQRDILLINRILDPIA